MRKDQHFPVLLEEVLQYLNPQEGESFLDLTAGYGGHASEVLERTFSPKKASLVDRDQNAVAFLKEQFKGQAVNIIHKDYLAAAQELNQAGKQFDMILADLGVSSPHLDNASRGFSIRLDGPLDMRMDERQKLTAYDIVNNYSEESLRGIIRKYGEEPRANKITRFIVESRPVRSTHELAAIVARAWPGPKSRAHPATRTFQALRMAVNDELDLLEKALPVWIDLLAPGGRIVVISFHSLEDRIVKRTLNEMAGNRYDASLMLLSKQIVTGSAKEIVFNPRARSAKLRAAAKINTQKKGEV
ncbi:16S rRNA (cytosine(1402)-N(4))-methyltransferase RsmH [Candidatus Saccharibacteria bacterium]|nr:16S rRNA (cytosine(1402)-N(4))-methyltransferase RsmH [Candidatus Saccharibacteria bacterium]